MKKQARLCISEVSIVWYCLRHGGQGWGSGSESLAQWGLSLLGAMLLANPLTPALTWRMPRPLHAPDTLGQRGRSEYQPVASFSESYTSKQQCRAELMWTQDFEHFIWEWFECKTDTKALTDTACREETLLLLYYYTVVWISTLRFIWRTWCTNISMYRHVEQLLTPCHQSLGWGRVNSSDSPVPRCLSRHLSY